MKLEFKTQDNCSKLQLQIALNEVKKRIINYEYLRNKWNDTKRKNLEGYVIAQFKITSE